MDGLGGRMSSGPPHSSQGRGMLDGCPTCQDCKFKSWGSAASFVVTFYFPVFDLDSIETISLI